MNTTIPTPPRAGMHRALRIGAVVAGGAALIVSLVFFLTKGAVEAADRFLSMIPAGQLDEAYAATASAFQSRHDRATFEHAVNAMGLSRFESARWTTRSVEGAHATLEGTFRMAGEEVVPVVMQLVKEGGAWKVLAVEPTAGGVDGDEVALPSEHELAALAMASLLTFNQAVLSGDFTVFHATLAQVWQEQTTPAALRETFRSFVEQRLDLTEIGGTLPRFAGPPVVDENGVLFTSGTYETPSLHVAFELKYYDEGDGWALVGVNVQASQRPAPEGA